MHQHIVIEGPLGVGKTSLALLLAEKFNADTLMEDVDENPFLLRFYQNPKAYAFQAQIFFLLRRYQPVLEIGQMDLFKRTIISDYLFDKDRIFARVNLDDNEFWLYEQLFHMLRKRLRTPDLVIFLQAKTEVLLKRIKRRNRKYERSIDVDYLDRINQAFNSFFFHFNDAPLLVINASEIDFVHVPGDLEDLLWRIKKMESGVQYYVPMSSKS